MGLAAMTETAESGEGIGALAAEAAGSKRIALEDYEVTFFDADLEHTASPDP
jgi:hypothetical protein